MKTFRFRAGHTAGRTMTVGELRAKLKEYPDDMPVVAEWEGQHACFGAEPNGFSVERVGMGHPDDECDGLVIDVNIY